MTTTIERIRNAARDLSDLMHDQGVSGFEELHDICDANMAAWNYAEDNGLKDPSLEVLNMITEQADENLRRGRSV